MWKVVPPPFFFTSEKIGFCNVGLNEARKKTYVCSLKDPKISLKFCFFDTICERNGELELKLPGVELELERNGISKWNWNCERNGKNSGTVHALSFPSPFSQIFFPRHLNNGTTMHHATDHLPSPLHIRCPKRRPRDRPTRHSTPSTVFPLFFYTMNLRRLRLSRRRRRSLDLFMWPFAALANCNYAKFMAFCCCCCCCGRLK